MPAVQLREVTRENWMECVRLRVADDQQGLVASNPISLAQSKFEPECVPQAIYAGEQVVGFTMYEVRRDGTAEVVRLLVGQAHQGRGYGRAAMQEVIRRLRAQHACTRIRTSYVPQNTGAAALYRSLGFRETGEIDQGEIVVELTPGAVM